MRPSEGGADASVMPHSLRNSSAALWCGSNVHWGGSHHPNNAASAARVLPVRVEWWRVAATPARGVQDIRLRLAE
jgi:hypothetical protein